jgi:alkanesulfonate monooxygenase SsuD/methylene tetrahydromethanopterin reductase-like flavin-dependent oxidoreductase (luciferase family)
MTGFVVGRDEAEARDRLRLVVEHRGDAGDPEEFLASTRPTWIIGSVDEVAERLNALRDAGVARVMCQHLLYTDLDTIALIGGELAPTVA